MFKNFKCLLSAFSRQQDRICKPYLHAQNPKLPLSMHVQYTVGYNDFNKLVKQTL